MSIRIRDPQSGKEGTATPDALIAAIQGGAEVLEPVAIYDPQSKKTGTASPEALRSALEGGAVPVGSRAHTQKTISPLDSAIRGIAQGATFDFADEIQAAVRAPFGEGSLADNYRSARDAYRQMDELSRAENPKAHVGGQLGAGIATSFVPGIGSIGALKAGATPWQIAKSGATIGALSGFGSSDADLTKGDVLGAALDTGAGGLVGAGMSVGTHWLGEGLGKSKDFIVDRARNVFDPDINRAVAMGAKTKDVSELLKGQVAGRPSKQKRALDELARNNVFEGAPTGATLMQRVSDLKRVGVDEMNDAMSKVGDDIVGDTQDIFLKAAAGKETLGERLTKVLENSRFDEVGNANGAAMEVIQRVEQTGGNLRKLWEVKKLLGAHAKKAFDKPSKDRLAADEIFIEANDHLDDILSEVTDAVAKKHNIPGLSAANAKFSAASTWENQLAKQEGASKWQAVVGGIPFRDAVAGSMGSAVLMGLGVPADVAMPLGVAGSVAHGAFRSAPGRMIRANIGEKMLTMRNQQGSLAGQLPRTAEAVQSWIAQNLDNIRGMVPPEVASRLEGIASAQQSEAGEQIKSLLRDQTMRGLIMQFTRNLVPSKFQTELDGHVYSAEDKELAAKEYRKMGLTPVDEAQKISETNRTGRLDPSVFAPAPPDYGDIIEQFNGRLDGMGF